MDDYCARSPHAAQPRETFAHIHCTAHTLSARVLPAQPGRIVYYSLPRCDSHLAARAHDGGRQLALLVVAGAIEAQRRRCERLAGAVRRRWRRQCLIPAHTQAHMSHPMRARRQQQQRARAELTRPDVRARRMARATARATTAVPAARKRRRHHRRRRLRLPGPPPRPHQERQSEPGRTKPCPAASALRRREGVTLTTTRAPQPCQAAPQLPPAHTLKQPGRCKNEAHE
jgi:hypothetical protein